MPAMLITFCHNNFAIIITLGKTRQHIGNKLVFIVYSTQDEVSRNSAAALMAQESLREAQPIGGMRHFLMGHTDVLELGTRHLDSDFLDSTVSTDCIIFLSRHSSTAGVPAFTVHPEGNWSAEAKIGGRPRTLSVASPPWMLRVLSSMKRNNTTGIPVTYEATHHGPLLSTPSLYAEIGGNQDVWADKGLASVLSRSVVEAIDTEVAYDKVALGIGGLHYADKFTRLALEGKFAFGHIMPKYYAGEVGMIEQAISRSIPRPDVAAIEWKSLKSNQRDVIIAKLDELGLDHVRV